MTSRDETISRIKTALKKRSGKSWSVTGGKGTAWGWIKIDVPPAKRVWNFQLRSGLTVGHGMDDYEEIETGTLGGHMSPTDRAEGRTPSKIAEPYWD